jgi:hypothetical protein
MRLNHQDHAEHALKSIKRMLSDHAVNTIFAENASKAKDPKIKFFFPFVQ